MINKDGAFLFKEVEVIENPNLTIFQNDKKKLLEKIQFLINNDPDNEEIKDGLNNPNIIEDIKWKIYQKALSPKYNNHVDEALKMIKLIQIFLTQHLKWYSLHLKLLAIKKDWDHVEKEKFN
jgi:hypothetical protein